MLINDHTQGPVSSSLSGEDDDSMLKMNSPPPPPKPSEMRSEPSESEEDGSSKMHNLDQQQQLVPPRVTLSIKNASSDGASLSDSSPTHAATSSMAELMSMGNKPRRKKQNPNNGPLPCMFLAPFPQMSHGNYLGALSTHFGDNYMRNHKATTTKNLRCFPRCGHVHKNNGFCGTSVEAWLHVSASAQDSSEFRMEAYSEFAPVGSLPTIDLDTTQGRKDVEALGMYRGEIVRVAQDSGDGDTGTQQYRISISREGKGWHYGWMAGRGQQAGAQHEMRVYIFEKLTEGDNPQLTCRLMLTSTPFNVRSRKRERGQNRENKRLRRTGSDANGGDEDDEGDDDEEEEEEESQPSPPLALKTASPKNGSRALNGGAALQNRRFSQGASALIPPIPPSSANFLTSQSQQQQQQRFGGDGMFPAPPAPARSTSPGASNKPRISPTHSQQIQTSQFPSLFGEGIGSMASTSGLTSSGPPSAQQQRSPVFQKRDLLPVAGMPGFPSSLPKLDGSSLALSGAGLSAGVIKTTYHGNPNSLSGLDANTGLPNSSPSVSSTLSQLLGGSLSNPSSPAHLFGHLGLPTAPGMSPLMPTIANFYPFTPPNTQSQLQGILSHSLGQSTSQTGLSGNMGVSGLGGIGSLPTGLQSPELFPSGLLSQHAGILSAVAPSQSQSGMGVGGLGVGGIGGMGVGEDWKQMFSDTMLGPTPPSTAGHIQLMMARQQQQHQQHNLMMRKVALANGSGAFSGNGGLR